MVNGGKEVDMGERGNTIDTFSGLDRVQRFPRRFLVKRLSVQTATRHGCGRSAAQH